MYDTLNSPSPVHPEPSDDPVPPEREALQGVLGPEGYVILGGPMTVTAQRSGSVSSYDVQLGIGTRVVSSGGTPSAYVLHLPLRGAADLHLDGCRVFLTPGFAAIAPPGCPMFLHSMVACTEVVLTIDREELERHASPAPSRPTTIDLGHGAGRAFRESALTPSVPARYLVALLVAALDEHAGRQGNAVSQVVEAVGREPARQYTVAELAREHGLSVRSLQRAFVRDVGMTPREFLLGLRLGHAHRVLYASSPESVTVSAVAQEWGFRHLGRFAQQYRSTFGEAPSETLRR